MTLEAIRRILAGNLAAGKPLLAGTPIDDDAYRKDLLQVIDAAVFKLTDASITADDTRVCVTGRGHILRFAGIRMTMGFEAPDDPDDDDLYLMVEAAVDGIEAFAILERFGSPLRETKLKWRYGPLRRPDGPDWIPPVSLAIFRARLALPEMDPVAINVHPPASFGQETAWAIEGDFPPKALPGLDPLLHWLGGGKTAGLFPPRLMAEGGLSLRNLDIRFDPAAGRVTSVALALALEKPWSPGIGRLTLDDLLLGVMFSHDDTGAATLSAEVTGHLEIIPGTPLAFSLTHAGGLSTLHINSEAGVPLPGLKALGELVGGGDMAAHLPDLLMRLDQVRLKRMDVVFDGKLRRAGIEVVAARPIPLAGGKAHLEGTRLQLSLAPSETPPLAGELTGLVKAGSAVFPVEARIAKALAFSSSLHSLDLQAFFPELPKAFPRIALSDAGLHLSTAGVMSISGALSLDFQEAAAALDMPLPQSITQVHLRYFSAGLNLADGSWHLAVESDVDIPLTDTAAGRLRLHSPKMTIRKDAAGISFRGEFQLRGFMAPDPNVRLDLPHIRCAFETGRRTWEMTVDDAELQLFGSRYRGFSGHIDNREISLIYGGGKTLPLVDWPGAGRVDLDRFTLFARKADAAVGPDPGAESLWHFGVSGQADVSLAGLLLPRLQLEVTDQGLQAVVDHPAIPAIVIDGWEAPPPQAMLHIDRIALTYEKAAGNAVRWRLDAADGGIRFQHIPSLVRAYFRDLAQGVSLHVGDDGAWVKAAVGEEIPFPELKFRIGIATEIRLGRPRVRVDTVGIGLGTAPYLSCGLTVGLPRQPQWVGDLLNDHCGFELRVARALQLQVTSSPFKAIQDGVHRKGRRGLWWHWKLQDEVEFWFMVPQFEYGGTTWDLRLGVESVGAPRLPLAPVKALLAALGIDRKRLAYLPDSMPLNGIDLRDGKTLYHQVKRLLGGRIPEDMDAVIQKALAAIRQGLSYMPDDFQDYLVSSVPKTFFLRMGVDPKGGAVIGLETEGDPLRLIFPAMMALPPSPELVGIELRAFSFGVAAGGLLSILTTYGHIDRFDLLTIAAVLAERDKQWSNALKHRMYLEKLFALIPNAFPVPIPITYDHVGWDLKSWLGIEMHTHFYFPEPPHLLWNWIAAAIRFFTQPDYQLHTEKHPPLAGKFTLGENYIKLPKYLGADPGKVYGLDHNLPALDVDQSLSFLLDGLKFSNPGFIIQSLPLLDERTDPPRLLPFRINRSHIDFGPLRFDVAWCMTTREEFKRVRHLPVVIDALRAANDPDVLQSLPSAARGPAYEKGFVLLFSEETAIHPIAGVKAQFGMALTGGGGFETGIQLTGTIAGHLSLTLRGDLSVPPPPGGGVRITGKFGLDWGDTPLIDYDQGVTVTDHSFELDPVRLKLHGDDCVVEGALSIDVRKGVTLEGHLRWTLGDPAQAVDVKARAFFSPAGIDVDATDTRETKVFGNLVRRISAYLHPAAGEKGAAVAFDTDPLNNVFRGEFQRLAGTLEKEVEELRQAYETIFEDFSRIFSDVETIRKELPKALDEILQNAHRIYHKQIDDYIDNHWPKKPFPPPGKDAAKRKARETADQKAAKPLANLSDLRKRIPNANTDALKSGLIGAIKKALDWKSFTVSLKQEISPILPDKKITIQILQQSHINTLKQARELIPKIPGKRTDSKEAWRRHYFREQLEHFVDGIARSIAEGVMPPRLAGLSAGMKLEKDASTKVRADVMVVYKDPRHPFETRLTIDLKNLVGSLPVIAREFSTQTQPKPPEPPPPPEP